MNLNIQLFFILLLFLFAEIDSYAQKSLPASRINEKVVVDGILDEPFWQQTTIATDFINVRPNPGKPASFQTKVMVAYDDFALYIAAICIDDPHQVSKILSLRDDFNANIDNFQVYIDTYNDNQNGFIFGVSSMGVQYDAKIFSATKSPELNMVWQSAVSKTDNGWQLEMKIPYSAFRFAKKDIQNWGVNFSRYISRFREESTWNPIQPDFDNWMAQCGDLTGVEGIKPPLRLAFMPYLSGYSDHFPQPNGNNWSYSYNGGMDIKYGINEAFTMDMTLVPDFGQVQFDNQVLNLSPFEVQFNENRQFFTEGTELFNKAGLFYSRRIGIQAPFSVLSTQLHSDEMLSAVPQSTQLYNATKISGRNKAGLGIGLFNAITAPQYATAISLADGSEREVLVSPLTNYNVLVLDQNLKNNSFVTLTNTNVLREGSFYDANVTALNTKFNNKNNKYFVSGSTAWSQKYFVDKNVIGHNWRVSAGKQTGKVVYNTSYFEESDTYDPNDLGFNTNNNKRILTFQTGYRIFKPFWILNQMSSNLSISYNRLYHPNVYTATYIDGNLFVNNRKFHAAGISFNASVTPSFDYFEPRRENYFFERPRWLNGGVWISSNYQKKFALDVSLYGVLVDRPDWKEWNYKISPRLRMSDKLFLIYEWSQSFSYNGQGYAVPFGIPVNMPNSILFGNRNRFVTTNTLNLNYTLTHLMGITFRLRHYRTALSYNYFYDLQTDGTLIINDFRGLDENGNQVYNNNFNAFTIDMVYRWVFLPGSEINIVWKNAIFSSDKLVDASYLENVNTIFDYSQLNSFSIKVLYWLDYLYLKKKN
jgi:hypothetical protein